MFKIIKTHNAGCVGGGGGGGGGVNWQTHRLKKQKTKDGRRRSLEDSSGG